MGRQLALPAGKLDIVDLFMPTHWCLRCCCLHGPKLARLLPTMTVKHRKTTAGQGVRGLRPAAGAVMVALVSNAANAGQKLALLFVFHPLGDHSQTQALAEGDNGSGDGCVTGVGDDMVDERLVDLQFVERQAPFLTSRASLYCELVWQVLRHAAAEHMIIGTLRLFGFNVFRNTYKPLPPESILEFWNRYYYYFKELT
jgi:hypothetical protein